MPEYVGAIDQGTTSTRFIVFSRSGQIVATAQKEHEQIYPRPGWVEHSPQEIWTRTQEVIAEAMQSKGLKASDLAAIGITNQRETTVVWNRKTGQAVYNAIVWQDTRVSSYVDDLAKAGGQDRFRAKTGLPLATYFSGLKIRWILENVPGARALAESGDIIFGNIDTFVLWNLTGGTNGGIHVTDVTNASRTQLMNLETLAWDEEILPLFGIPSAMLPRIASSSELYGNVATGPLAGVPLAGDLGDQQAALVGQTCFEPRPGEEHLRHRLLSSAQHRYQAGAVEVWIAHDGGVPIRQATGALCAGRQCCRRGCAGAVASRQPEPRPKQRRG